MGSALKTIRDGEFPNYKSTGLTWDEYCKTKFRFGKRAADYYIAAWLTAQNCGVPADYSPRSLRPLTGLTPKHQKEAWSKAKSLTKNGRPSSKDIQVAASQYAAKPLAGWTLRAAHAVHELHFKIGLKKALAGATEEQIREYCGRLDEYALDWAERHNAIPATFDPEIVRSRCERRSPAVDKQLNVDDEGEFDKAEAAARFEFFVRQAYDALSELYELFDLEPSLAETAPLKESLQELCDVAVRLFDFMASEGVLEPLLSEISVAHVAGVESVNKKR
jgi:hypothetical protein